MKYLQWFIYKLYAKQTLKTYFGFRKSQRSSIAISRKWNKAWIIWMINDNSPPIMWVTNKRSKKLFLIIRNEYMNIFKFSTRNEKAKKYYLKARFCRSPLLKGSPFIGSQFYRVLVLVFQGQLQAMPLILTLPRGWIG